MRPTEKLSFALALAIAAAATLSARGAQSPAAPTTPTAEAAAPTTGPMQSDPAAVKWLRTLAERHRDHRRASGEFRQTKTDPVFLEEIKATGRFYYERPNRFRCDYNPPEASSAWVIGNIVTLYFPELKQVERYRLKRGGSGIGDVNQMLLAFGIEPKRILKYFVVKNDPKAPADRVRLIFHPKAPPPERPFKEFILELSKPDLTPKRFTILGEDGDKTVVDITVITWNPTLPPDTFVLKFPRDVEIIEQE